MLGAILYRAGRSHESIRQLTRSVEVHRAGGTPYQALFLAMAQHQLGHAHEARHWLWVGRSVDPIAMRDPGDRDTSWISRLELNILRREASAMIEPIEP
jgi:hypothetical protein